MRGVVLGRLVDRADSRGDCGLRGSCGRCPAGGWVCVPAQLVAWSEAPQYCCPEAVGWGWELKSWREDSTMALAGTSVLEVE